MSGTVVFPMNMIRLCIDGYGNDLSGRVYSKLILMPLLFSGCSGMLLQMDDVFEQVGYPQAFQVRRTFFKPKKLRGSIRIPKHLLDDTEIEKQRGECRTFDIIVQSRNQSGWQGILLDMERTSAKKFKSEMELLHCICQELGVSFGRAKRWPAGAITKF